MIRPSGSRAIAALLAVTFVLLASSCGQTTSATQLPRPAAAPSPPPGGPVPAELLGDWFLPPAAVDAVSSNGTCPSPPNVATCFFRLTFTATNYEQAFTAIGGTTDAGQGGVVVNNNEIDFFSGRICAIPLPGGVGRYTWRLTAGILYFTLISDPCTRSAIYTWGGWSRAL
jgi:hypothetical protein